jgi:pimeloyl-ACP methyl ester carboxylesterase
MHMAILAIVVMMSAGANAADTGGTAVSADQVAIHYSVQGEGEPALVFIHGWCCDAGYWKEQVPVFSKHNMVVTIDLAGHGESGMERKEYTMESFGEDVAAVVNKLELKSVILIGHSMGGRVNLAAALRIPDRVLALVGVDNYQDFEMKIPPEQIEQFLSAFRADFSGRTRNYVQTLFPSGADSALVETVVSDMANEAVGRKHTKSYSVKLMPGRGHFPMLEDPATFNALLAETIGEITGKSE